MSADDAIFDPQRIGVEAHYGEAQRQRIRRLMLEDWKAAGVKLPTYMKLVARFIAPLGIPEDWLTKLSHQTMDKMLKGVSTPRHEFWACLHIYLIKKKYGAVAISETTPTEIDQLGDALARFGGAAPISTLEAGDYALPDGSALKIAKNHAQPFARLGYIRTTQTPQSHSDPFNELVTASSIGTAIHQYGMIKGVIRDVLSRRIDGIAIDESDLLPLADGDIGARLNRLAGAE